jgi:predicted protein tyrosine phosphatase
MRPLVRVPHVLISIRDPGCRKRRLLKHQLRRGTLYLAFDDTKPAANFMLPPNVRLMTPKHAADIWAFILKHLGKIEAVVIHGEQGAIRCPAVAATPGR